MFEIQGFIDICSEYLMSNSAMKCKDKVPAVTQAYERKKHNRGRLQNQIIA